MGPGDAEEKQEKKEEIEERTTLSKGCVRASVYAYLVRMRVWVMSTRLRRSTKGEKSTEPESYVDNALQCMMLEHGLATVTAATTEAIQHKEERRGIDGKMEKEAERK